MTRNRTDRTASFGPVVRGMHRLAGGRAAVAVGTLGIVAVMALATVALSASVITNQGYLSNDQGAPLPGPVNLEFGIYPASTGGSPLWSEVHNGVALANGSYTVLLGSVTAFPGDLFASDSLWIQTSVDGTVMPRRVIGDVPRAIYAERAAIADSVVGWAAPTSEYWQPNGANISNSNSGNVGIGTNGPQSKLDVAGRISASGGMNVWGASLIPNDGGSATVGPETGGPFTPWLGFRRGTSPPEQRDARLILVGDRTLQADVSGNPGNVKFIVDGALGIGTSTPWNQLVVDGGNARPFILILQRPNHGDV